MPQNARTLPRKHWLNMAGVCGVVLLTSSVGAKAGQSQSQLSVSAYVMITGTVATTLSQAPTQFVTRPAQQDAQATSFTSSGESESASQDNASAAISDNAKTVCASVAVSCSGRAPMRINVDGSGESGALDQCEPNISEGQKSISLCGSAGVDTSALGIIVEY